MIDTWQPHHELVPSEAGNNRGLWACGLQAIGSRCQGRVADDMTELVVDPGEVVEIYHHDRAIGLLGFAYCVGKATTI